MPLASPLSHQGQDIPVCAHLKVSGEALMIAWAGSLDSKLSEQGLGASKAHCCKLDGPFHATSRMALPAR